MLTLIQGPYFPVLEDAFLRAVRRAKKGDPWSKIAVVSPSARILERLQRRLAEKGAVIDVHFHSFQSLAEKIVEETGGLGRAVISDPVFQDELVRQLLREKAPFKDVEDLAFPDGFPAAVRGTLRDLSDAGVDHDGIKILAEAIRDEDAHLGRNADIGSLLEILELHRSHLKKWESLDGLAPRSALFRAAEEAAQRSSFLARYAEIFFYGFYDLTGLQTDFFRSVAKARPSRLFFPMGASADNAFARRFLDDVVLGLTSEREEPPAAPDPVSPSFSIHNVSGRRDEAWVVASEIHRWHEKEGVPYGEIAVVARSRERISGDLLRELSEHGIPFSSTQVHSLADHPAVVEALKELSVLSSEPGWPQSDSWAAYAEKLAARWGGRLSIPESAMAALGRLPLLGYLSSSVAWEDFSSALRNAWRTLSEPWPGQSRSGVSVLHAEAARGLPFQVVFLVGAEERVFPRIVREDPFFRDDARLVARRLGFKLSPKLLGMEEERLLFHLLTTSASRHISFTYQRSDEEGAVVGPSLFLRDWASRAGRPLEEIETVVPRPYLAKILSAEPEALSVRQFVLRALANGASKSALSFLTSLKRDVVELKRRLTASAALEKRGTAGAWDGLLPAKERSYRPARLSPTTLETYGECPFRYFGERLLGLAEPESETDGTNWPADIRGRALHECLELFYRRVTKDGSTGLPASPPWDVYEVAFAEVIGSKKPAEMKVHPVLWEALRTQADAELRAFIAADWAECVESGFSPAWFELGIKKTLPAPLDGLLWEGHIDRVDAADDRLRVVDYKSGAYPLAAKPATMVLRGRKAQPVVYLALLEAFWREMKGRAPKALSFLYKRLRLDKGDAALTEKEWADISVSARRVVGEQLKSMEKGIFPILPSDSASDAYCGHCHLSLICRKNHQASRARAEAGPAGMLRRKREVVYRA